jgi:hypothetical protein
VLTQQAPLPENYILRAVGIAFLILSYLELKIAGDLARYQGLVLAFAALPALFCVTIILQALQRGFAGQPALYRAAWYWWLNGSGHGGLRHRGRRDEPERVSGREPLDAAPRPADHRTRGTRAWSMSEFPTDTGGRVLAWR